MKYILLITVMSTALFFKPQSITAQTRDGLIGVVESVLDEINPFSAVSDIADAINEGKELLDFIKNKNNSLGDCVRKTGLWLRKVTKAIKRFVPPPVRLAVSILVNAFWAVFGPLF